MRKHGIKNFECSILSQNINTISLDACETYWVSYFQSNNPMLGYNLTSGGGQAFTHNQSTRDKISHANKGRLAGNKNPFWGKKHKPDVQARINAANKGRVKSKEELQKLSISLKNSEKFKQRYVKVKQFTRSGDLIKVHESLASAAAEIAGDIAASSSIHWCCVGKTKFAYGFVWRFYNDDFDAHDIKSSRMYAKIAQYDLADNLIHVYDSVKDVISSNPTFSHSGIVHCCKEKYKTSHGYVWKYHV
jgi:group I intron endonuclease